LGELPLVLLREAPAHDDRLGRVRELQRLEVAQLPVQLVVGVLTDGAGVEQHEVGRLGVSGRPVAHGLEDPGGPLGVVLVHLAPEGADEVGA
jgi:hypothetical protein